MEYVVYRNPNAINMEEVLFAIGLLMTLCENELIAI